MLLLTPIHNTITLVLLPLARHGRQCRNNNTLARLSSHTHSNNIVRHHH